MSVTRLSSQLEQLASRVADLRGSREAREVETADGKALLDALFTEFELAEEELRVASEELDAQASQASEAQQRSDRERRLLRQAFTHLPVPVFLVNHEGVVRRVNQEGARLLGTTSTYLTGKPLSAFVDLPSRPTFRSLLSAALRGTGDTTFDTRLSRSGHLTRVRLRLSRFEPGEETEPTLAVVARPLGAGEDPAGEAEAVDAPAAAAVAQHEQGQGPPPWDTARRLQTMTGMTRLLLDEASLHEPVALGRAARLLQAELADSVLIDLVREGSPQRVAVAGYASDSRTNVLEDLDPADAPALLAVLETGSSALYDPIEDEYALGQVSEGRPTLAVLDAGSLLCVPVRHAGGLLGVLTLIRQAGRAAFDMADLALMEEIGEHLGLALRMERSYRRNSDAARTLQASLLPHSLPAVPGVEVAATYRLATEDTGVGGDFYDVFESVGGFGFVLGDVCGKGEEAAVVTAAARNWVKLASLSEADPAEVLRRVNHAMLTHQGTDRFVTAVVGRLLPDDESDGGAGDGPGSIRVRVASAGHPQTLVLRDDGGVRFLDGGGLPLGVFEGMEPASEDVELGPGDTLLLYSDGVTDTRATDGSLYGESRLADVLARNTGLSPAGIVKGIEEELKTYSSDRMHDDVAMLAFQVSGSWGSAAG